MSLTMGFFRKTKDRLIEKTAAAVLNETVFRDYGEITSLDIDSRDKTIHFEALLRGEREPIRVEILHYEIVERDGRACFVAKKIRTSREWITKLAEQKLVDELLPLPQKLSGLIARLL